MNKLFTKIVGAALGLTMAIGVGVAVSSRDAIKAEAATSELTFDLTSNPGDWPTTNSTTATDYTYTLNNVDYVFNLKNIKQNSGYLMCTYTASLGLPAIAGKKLTKVVASNSSQCSTSTRVGVSSSNSSASYISGGAYQTWSTQSSSYTYNLSSTAANTMYYLYITNKNCQMTQLVLTYVDAETAQTITVSPSSKSVYVDETITLTTDQTSTGWSITGNNTIGATLSRSAGKSTVVSATSAGSVTVRASGTGLSTVDNTLTFNARPATAYISPAKSSTSGYTGQNESISFTYGYLAGSLSVVSNDTNVVTVGTPSLNAGSGTVQFNFVGAGTNVAVDFKDGSTTLATVTVGVTKTAFTTSPVASATIKTGKTVTLTAVLNSGGTINWSSDDTSVATVAGGVVTGVAAGSTTITATSADDSSVHVESEITVVPAPAYETGFESADGFEADNVYNTTKEHEGPSGHQWKFYYGTPTTDAPITGSQCAQLRKYNGMSGNPYLEMEFDVTDGHGISFNAKCGTASGYGVEVFYSTDSGSSYTSLLTKSVGTSATTVSAEIATYISSARFKILFTGDNPSSGNRKMSIDDVEITTMAEPTDPTITITSKDGSGMMSGILGDIQEVTYTTAYASGLTLNWVLTDTASVVDWEAPYVEFKAVGADATLTAQLLDSNEDVVAYDTITLHTLVPLLDVKVNGASRSNYALYADGSITITATPTNKPDSATLVWTTDDTEEDYSTFNTSTGLFEAKASGSVHLVVEMMYKGNAVASDFLNITISALEEPTLVISTGTGKTSYKFGEEIDTTDWSATYTDNHGVAHTDVLNDLEFDSLDFIGTKAIKATYNGTVSNTVNITVTNNGATCDTETILEGSGFSSSSMPSGWSHSGAGSDYAASHAPYRLKMDGTGDKVIATVNTSASVIYVELGVKLASGATTCTFDVTAKDSGGNDVATGVLSFDGAQNATLTDSTSLSYANGKTVTSIEFSFNKGSANVGVGTGSVSVNNAASFASRQALAWARYFLEQTDGYCEASISSSVKTNIINEYNWMIAESKAAFKDADIVRGKGVSYDNDLSEALSRYVNMIEEKGYSDADFLNLGNDVINKSSTLINGLREIQQNSTSALILVVSMMGLAAVGGYFFLRKRKEQ